MKITAPFTEEQVQRLNEWQGRETEHPFTCCSPEHIGECERRLGTSEGILKATKDGWICPCSQYKQFWAHDFMANPPDESFSIGRIIPFWIAAGILIWLTSCSPVTPLANNLSTDDRIEWNEKQKQERRDRRKEIFSDLWPVFATMIRFL